MVKHGGRWVVPARWGGGSEGENGFEFGEKGRRRMGNGCEVCEEKRER